MKQDRYTARMLRYLLTGSLLAGVPPLLADPAAECRQEVKDYGIPPEQAEDYLTGCILSRGGSPATDTGEGAMPVDDPGVAASPDNEQMNDAGQPDDVTLPGGDNGPY